MVIESVNFERIEDAPAGLDNWQVRVVLSGSGFEVRSVPMVVAVGEQHAELLAPVLIEEGIEGIQGLLAEVPENGDEVAVGWADGPLVPTGHEFSGDSL